MKKFNILLVFSLAVSMSFAQVINSERINSLHSMNNLAVAEEANMQYTSAIENADLTAPAAVGEYVLFPDISSAVRSVANDPLRVSYRRPQGTFYGSMLRDYRVWSLFRIHTPAHVPVVYAPVANNASAGFVWTLDNAANTPIDTAYVNADGVLNFVSSITPAGFANFLPKVTANVGAETASFVLGGHVAAGSRFMASMVARSVEPGGTQSTIFADTEELPALTLANPWTQGTGLIWFVALSSDFNHATAGRAKGFMQVIPALASPLFVESMTIYAIDMPGGGAPPVPVGGELKLELFYENEDGSLEKIAESVTEEFVPTSNNLGVFTFQFIEEEAGFEFPAPFVIEAGRDVVVIISGFDETWNFAVLAASTDDSYTYTLFGDDLSTAFQFNLSAPSNPNYPGVEMYIQFNAMFNTLVPFDGYEDVVIEFPVNGGWGITGSEGGQNFNDFPVYTSFNLLDLDDENDLKISRPDWITGMQADDEYFDSHNVMMLFFQAAPLPDGVKGREGEIVLSLYGASITIPVVQGEIGSGVSNPTVSNVGVFVSNNAFELSYTADFNTVTIFNISGQAVAMYDLPTNGSFLIPTDNLAKGAYIVRFAGAQVETVKVIK
jgi:hypothetical protein